MVSPAGTNYSQSIKITTITMITGYFGILKDLKTPIFGHLWNTTSNTGGRQTDTTVYEAV